MPPFPPPPPKKRYPHLNPRNPVTVTVYGKKRLCRCDYIKSLVMRTLSWITQTDPMSSETFLEERDRRFRVRERYLKMLTSKLPDLKTVEGPQPRNVGGL